MEGAQTFDSLQRTLAIVIILLRGGRLPKGVGLDCTASPPLLPISLWFLLLIFFNLFLVMLGLCCCMEFSLLAVSGGFSSLHCSGFSLQWLLLWQRAGSGAWGFSSCGMWAQ